LTAAQDEGMQNRLSKKKRRDLNQLAKAIVEQATGDDAPAEPARDGRRYMQLFVR